MGTATERRHNTTMITGMRRDLSVGHDRYIRKILAFFVGIDWSKTLLLPFLLLDVPPLLFLSEWGPKKLSLHRIQSKMLEMTQENTKC